MLIIRVIGNYNVMSYIYKTNHLLFKMVIGDKKEVQKNTFIHIFCIP